MWNPAHLHNSGIVRCGLLVNHLLRLDRAIAVGAHHYIGAAVAVGRLAHSDTAHSAGIAQQSAYYAACSSMWLTCCPSGFAATACAGNAATSVSCAMPANVVEAIKAVSSIKVVAFFIR